MKILQALLPVFLINEMQSMGLVKVVAENEYITVKDCNLPYYVPQIAAFLGMMASVLGEKINPMDAMEVVRIPIHTRISLKKRINSKPELDNDMFIAEVIAPTVVED